MNEGTRWIELGVIITLAAPSYLYNLHLTTPKVGDLALNLASYDSLAARKHPSLVINPLTFETLVTLRQANSTLQIMSSIIKVVYPFKPFMHCEQRRDWTQTEGGRTWAAGKGEPWETSSTREICYLGALR